jgi:hypothetical protein
MGVEKQQESKSPELDFRKKLMILASLLIRRSNREKEK